MQKLKWIHWSILSFGTFCLAYEQKLYVIHTPNQKMGFRLEGSQGTIYKLDSMTSLDSLLYSGHLPYPSSNPIRYQYVVLNNTDHVIDSEPFYRSNHHSGPLYEFYGRATTKQTDPRRLPRVRYQSASDSYMQKAVMSHRSLHPIDEIPTFHIHMDPHDLTSLHNQIIEEPAFRVNLTRITSDRFERYSHVELSLGGQTSKLFDKLTYSIQLDKKEFMEGFQKFKIRSCATDPSFLREKIYYDMLEAADIPASQASYIRLFVNGKAEGLYLIVDHTKGPFLQNIFGHGNKKYKEGALIQGQMQENPMAKGILKRGADMSYLGPSIKDYIDASSNTSAYKIASKNKNKHQMDGFKALVSMLEFVDQQARSKEISLAAWNKRLDVPLFLKNMAFELVLGNTDGYMGAAHNYMVYQDPDQHGRFLWISTDLDQAMGNSLRPALNTSGNALERLDRFGLLRKVHERPLLRQLFRSREIERAFQSVLKDISHTLLHPDTLYPYIDYMKHLIEQDVEWDQQLSANRVNQLKRQPQVYQSELEQRVLQLPLGRDFINRIENKSIDFKTAIKGNITGHPSIVSLYDWFRDTDRLLNDFFATDKETGIIAQ